MRRAWLPAALLLAGACASAPRPGPTPVGIAVSVRARDKAVARRQAVESLLPLFVSPAVLREKSAAVEKAAFASAKETGRFIGHEKLSKKGDSVVEVKIDALSAALQGAGLTRPPGYASGKQAMLLALGNRAAGATATDRFAADALEEALFGRSIQAQDADDDIIKLQHPITAKTEAETVAQAAAGGWTSLVTGGVADVARREDASRAWRGRARYTLRLYGVEPSTSPALIVGDGEALNVSSFSAVSDAIDAAAQDAAARVDALMARARTGKATISVVVSGYKDPAFLLRVVGDLRRTQGVDGAALLAWQGFDTMALFHAYATTLTASDLAAKLINAYPDLRITAIETDDNRVTIAGPEIPLSEDTGQEE